MHLFYLAQQFCCCAKYNLNKSIREIWSTYTALFFFTAVAFWTFVYREYNRFFTWLGLNKINHRFAMKTLYYMMSFNFCFALRTKQIIFSPNNMIFTAINYTAFDVWANCEFFWRIVEMIYRFLLEFDVSKDKVITC